MGLVRPGCDRGTFSDIDGLIYPSAMAGGAMNVAIYERGAPTPPLRPVLYAA
jgi:hypothetical protein